MFAHRFTFILALFADSILEKMVLSNHELVYHSFLGFMLCTLLFTKSAAREYSLYDVCKERKCGNVTVHYPFWEEEKICGFPNLGTWCRDNVSHINLPNRKPYKISHIDYDRRSLLLLSNLLDESCPSQNQTHPPPNLTWPAPLGLAPNHSILTIFFNCSTSFPLNDTSVSFNCTNGTTPINSYVALACNTGELHSAAASCQSYLQVPVKLKGGISKQTIHTVDYKKLIRDGFTLEWNDTSVRRQDCSTCSASGGRCGLVEEVIFKCFCPNQNFLTHCIRGDRKRNLKIGLGVGSGCIVIFATCICSIYWSWYRPKRHSAKILSKSSSLDPSLSRDPEGGNIYFGVPVFSRSELEEATNHFDVTRELGDGGFGTVYYGKLQDGREVAVKRLYQHNYRRVKQFMTEVEILTRLHHKHLVHLYGCTSHHSRELLLVYEYIPNGTVADHIHGDRAMQGLLPWAIRMSIAIETASALQYLHCSGIIHRDVKTHNILLDSNFCVKVADFGLSRLFPNDVTHVSTAPQGTPGYVDPEYHQCYQLTEKSDVYSFGVVLMELISSKPAVDITRDKHEINLSNYAISKIQKQAFSELIDPALGFSLDPEINRMTTSVAELAFRCLQQDKEMRPTMEDALEELKAVARTDDTKSRNPPPSPECEDAGLLGNIRLGFSPVSVTQRWHSNGSSSTYNRSN